MRALEGVAELEHAVLLQYLYAAASLKRRAGEGPDELQLARIRGWERTLLAIAREEMAHLAAVSNLLIAVGSTPWLVRPGLPGGRLAAPEPALALERFGPRSLARFIELEREESISGHYAAVRREIEASGDRVIRRIPVDRVDGWGVSGGARLPPVTDAITALAVVDAIVGQGAGAAPASHLERLLAVEAELAAEGPEFEPARPVAAARITNPSSRTVAEAFAAAYQATMLLLELYYALVQAHAGGATTARRAAQGLMGGVLRPLGEVLTELPLGDGAPGWTCGPHFAWDERVERPTWAAAGVLLEQAGAGLRAAHGQGRLTTIAENLDLAGRLVARAGEP
ncbi:MAG: ferritin-like domain-containing protein [Solirubrobacteraceae bacterium]